MSSQQPTSIKGSDGTVSFDGRFVTITHNWKASAGRGESKYPIAAVTGVELKPRLLSIQFTLVVQGGMQRMDRGGSKDGDPLTVELFKNQRTVAGALRDSILAAVAAGQTPPPAAPQDAVPAQPARPAQGLADQLAQLAGLHAQGVLSDAEFAAAKARLLGPQDAAPGQSSW